MGRLSIPWQTSPSHPKDSLQNVFEESADNECLVLASSTGHSQDRAGGQSYLENAGEALRDPPAQGSGLHPGQACRGSAPGLCSGEIHHGGLYLGGQPYPLRTSALTAYLDTSRSKLLISMNIPSISAEHTQRDRERD